MQAAGFEEGYSHFFKVIEFFKASGYNVDNESEHMDAKTMTGKSSREEAYREKAP
jgi:hypothetical protein